MVVPARPEDPPEAERSLTDPTLKISNHERLYISRAFAQAHQEASIRITNEKNQDQVVAESINLSHCEPVAWVAPVNGLEPHTPQILDLCEHLQDMVSDARLDIL
jgi:hypothetical protein